MSIFEFCHLMIRAKITNWVLLLSKIIHLKQLKNQLQLQSSNSFKFNKFLSLPQKELVPTDTVTLAKMTLLFLKQTLDR